MPPCAVKDVLMANLAAKHDSSFWFTHWHQCTVLLVINICSMYAGQRPKWLDCHFMLSSCHEYICKSWWLQPQSIRVIRKRLYAVKHLFAYTRRQSLNLTRSSSLSHCNWSLNSTDVMSSNCLFEQPDEQRRYWSSDDYRNKGDNDL